MARGQLSRRDAPAGQRRGRRLLGRAALEIQERRAARVARAHGGARLDRARMAEGVRRRRLEQGRSARAARGNGAPDVPRAADFVRHLDARPRAAEVRQRAAEARAPAEDRARRDPLVPGLFRARRRLGPRVAQDARRGPRRPLRHQRLEDLDQLRRQGRLDLLPGAHRLRGEEAGRHQLPAVRHAVAGHLDATDPADLRLLAVHADVLRQRAGAEEPTWSASSTRAGRSRSTCSRTSAT